MIISVVIACYNVAKHIESVVTNLPEEISNIIVVNDFAVDETDSVYLLRLKEQTNTLVFCIGNYPERSC